MVAEVRMLTLAECAAAYPQLRFAVGDHRSSGVVAESRADETYDLAGTGKLLLGLTLAELGPRDVGFLARPLTVDAEHRARARTGTLRLMSGELQLSVEDAVSLVLSTGDGACALALLDFTASEGLDLLAEARSLASELGLDAVQLSGLEAG